MVAFLFSQSFAPPPKNPPPPKEGYLPPPHLKGCKRRHIRGVYE